MYIILKKSSVCVRVQVCVIIYTCILLLLLFFLDLDYLRTPTPSSFFNIATNTSEDEIETSQNIYLHPQLSRGEIITKEILKYFI